jgi:hypothetical protein
MVAMIYRMMSQDLAKFGVVFFIFLMGFSQALYIIFQSFRFTPKDPIQAAALIDSEGECPDGDDDCKVVFAFSYNF